MIYNPQKVIDIAVSQLGYHEKESNSALDDFMVSFSEKYNKIIKSVSVS